MSEKSPAPPPRSRLRNPCRPRRDAAAAIFAIERVRALISHRVDLAGVVTLAFLRVSEDGERCRDALELLFRFLVVLVLVGMQILREPPVRPADFVIRSGAFHAQNGVQIVIHGTWSGWYAWAQL